MAKYDPLQEYLVKLPKDQKEITLSFEQIEKIICSTLPFSAHNYSAWWGNEKNGEHVSAHAWLGAGWKVESIDLHNNWVRFVRKKI